MKNPQFRDHSSWVWVGLGVVLVAVVAGVVGAKPLWEWNKNRRAEHFLEQARLASAEGRSAAVPAALSAAFSLAPHHPPVVRDLARYYSQYSHPEALGLWRELKSLVPLEVEDTLAFARSALAQDRYDLAIPLVEQLVAEAPETPGVLVFASEVVQRLGRPETALRLAEEALRRDPENVTNRWRVATLELSHSSPARQFSGKERLLALAGNPRPERVLAAKLLLTNSQLEKSEVRRLLRLFPPQTNEPLELKLVRLTLENREDPAGRKSRVRTLAEPYWNVEGRTNLMVISDWLRQVRDYPDILEVVPEDLALTDRQLFILLCSALGEAGQWDRMEALLAHPQAPSVPLVQEILRASAMHHAGRTNESLIHWKKAVSLAGTDMNQLQSIVRQAEPRGYKSIALEAWRPLLGDPRIAPRAAAEVIRLAESLRDLPAARDALRRLDQLQFLPTSQRSTLALYEALLNSDLGRAQSYLAKARQTSTETNLTAIASALLALRENQPNLAAQNLDPLPIDWDSSPPLWQVVRVAQLGRIGRRTEARELAQRVDVAVLSAPERALIEPWLP